jgi:hypothetical protein
MSHPLVDELLRDPPPDESDAARRERVQDALGALDDPDAVLALWDGLVSALAAVIRSAATTAAIAAPAAFAATSCRI